MIIPPIPTRAWKIAQDNGLSVDEATKRLEALVENGQAIKEEATRTEGGGFYFRKA
jgi:hypothetical protein